MMAGSNFVLHQILFPALVWFFLIWSLIGVAVGAGLIVASARMFRLFNVMNYYVSTRHALKPMAMAHDIDQGVRRHRRLIGALFVLGAVYSIYVMLVYFHTAQMVGILHLRYPPPVVAWILESARWSLIVLSLFALAVGVMLCLFPDALARLEAYANRWVSVRKLTLGADTMVLSLDKLVQAFPRAAGALILVAAMYVAANAAIVWLQFR